MRSFSRIAIVGLLSGSAVAQNPSEGLSSLYDYFSSIAANPEFTEAIAAVTANPSALSVLESVNSAAAAGSTIPASLVDQLPPQITAFYGSVASDVNSILAANGISTDDLSALESLTDGSSASATDALSESNTASNTSSRSSGTSSTQTSAAAEATGSDTSAASSFRYAGISAGVLSGLAAVVFAM